MPFVFSFRTNIIKIAEKSMLVNEEIVPLGWFVQLAEFSESIKVAEPGEANKPDLKKGQSMMVTWRAEPIEDYR